MNVSRYWKNTATGGNVNSKGKLWKINGLESIEALVCQLTPLVQGGVYPK